MCITPFGVKSKMTGETIGVPCGRCPVCVKRRASGWSFRLMNEYRQATSGYFLTLTYSTSTVPILSSGYMTINKRDPQLFLKRLRKAHPKHVRIKYYLCGEYGTRGKRPHYHVILFNASLPLIQPAWGLGQVHYGNVTRQSVGYCLKYMSKKGQIPMHANDNRVPEFALMSKGLGKNYITPAMKAWHLADLDNRMYCNLPDGIKISMPRYYKDRIYDEMQRKRVAFMTQVRMEREKTKRMLEEGDEFFNNELKRHKGLYVQMRYLSTKNDKL